jgi:phosphoglycolate phosphatase
MPQLQGLIFDLDGTLVDSAPDIRQALNATLAQHGRRELSLHEVKAMVGDGMMPLIDRAFAATGGKPNDFNAYQSFQAFIAHYRNLKADPSQLYPVARETIEHYHDAGVKLGICTNKQEAATLRLLEELGVRRFFGFVAGGDTFTTHKPHPDHVKGVIEKLKVSAANCAMVGDGLNDVRAAQGAGIPCIVVMHGYTEDYAALGADKLIKGFADLPDALSVLGFEIKK